VVGDADTLVNDEHWRRWLLWVNSQGCCYDSDLKPVTLFQDLEFDPTPIDTVQKKRAETKQTQTQTQSKQQGTKGDESDSETPEWVTYDSRKAPKSLVDLTPETAQSILAASQDLDEEGAEIETDIHKIEHDVEAQFDEEDIDFTNENDVAIDEEHVEDEEEVERSDKESEEREAELDAMDVDEKGAEEEEEEGDDDVIDLFGDNLLVHPPKKKPSPAPPAKILSSSTPALRSPEKSPLGSSLNKSFEVPRIPEYNPGASQAKFESAYSLILSNSEVLRAPEQVINLNSVKPPTPSQSQSQSSTSGEGKVFQFSNPKPPSKIFSELKFNTYNSKLTSEAKVTLSGGLSNLSTAAAAPSSTSSVNPPAATSANPSTNSNNAINDQVSSKPSPLPSVSGNVTPLNLSSDADIDFPVPEKLKAAANFNIDLNDSANDILDPHDLVRIEKSMRQGLHRPIKPKSELGESLTDSSNFPSIPVVLPVGQSGPSESASTNAPLDAMHYVHIERFVASFPFLMPWRLTLLF